MRGARIIFLAACGVTLSGCLADQAAFVQPVAATPPETATVRDPGEVKYYPSDEPVKLGLEYFNRGDFGLSAQQFEDAVAKAPEDAAAWVGLAASYDRIGRFDLADRAYRQAIKLKGETTEILNNLGYSYMLRGRLKEARRELLKAYEREPKNPTVVNNLVLLDSSERYIRRN